MIGLVAIPLLLLGATLLTLATLGVVRMPDVFTRLQAASKATSLGTGFVLIAAAVYFHDLAAITRALLTILFVLLTAPLAAHLIGHAAHVTGARTLLITDEWATDDAQADRAGESDDVR